MAKPDYNDDEYLRHQQIRRKKNALRRKRQLRKRMAIAAGVIAAGIIFGIAIPVSIHSSKSKESNKETAFAEEIEKQNVSVDNQSSANANKTNNMQTGEKSSTSTELSDAAASNEATTNDTAETEAPTAPTATPAPYVAPDRSDFAVQPGVPCGNNHMTDEKIVYLTLDDGPSANTITALDILDRYGVKCTFFVTNQNPEYAYLIKEAYDRGHTIALHTYSHDYETVYSSVDAYFADLEAIGNVVAEQIGYVPAFIRFPGGSCNQISADICPGIMSVLAEEVQARGYQYFDWNCSSGDGGPCTDPEELAAAATSVDYWDNIVLLSHDGVGKEPTMEALPAIIEYYLNNGFEFRAIDRTAYTSHQTIYN